MEPIASDGRRTVFLRVIAAEEAVDAPFGGEPYAALVWQTAPTFAAQKHRLCEALIASGCRYVMCAGGESEAWEEMADEAFTAQDLTEAELRERFVMTSSHEGEPMDEVAFQLIHTTRFGAHDFARFLILLIGDDPDIRQQLIAAIREEFAATGR